MITLSGTFKRVNHAINKRTEHFQPPARSMTMQAENTPAQGGSGPAEHYWAKNISVST
jgi:hypothetical protein